MHGTHFIETQTDVPRAKRTIEIRTQQTNYFLFNSWAHWFQIVLLFLVGYCLGHRIFKGE
jgi:hypothetical protein